LKENLDGGILTEVTPYVGTDNILGLKISVDSGKVYQFGLKDPKYARETKLIAGPKNNGRIFGLAA